MMNIWTFSGIILCALAAVMILREVRKEWTVWVILCVMILAFYYVGELYVETMDVVRGYTEAYPEIAAHTGVLIKGLGITSIAYTASEICKAAGENGLAGYVELAGKIELILLALPLFQKILSIAVGLL